MGRRLRLALVDGCHESWEAMPAAGPGRACAKCRREVVDLEGKTARQAQALLDTEEARMGSICARFELDPETGEATYAPEPRAPRSRSFLRGVALAATLAAGCESVSYAATPKAVPVVLAPMPPSSPGSTPAPAPVSVPLPPPPPAPTPPELATAPDAGVEPPPPPHPVRPMVMGRIARR